MKWNKPINMLVLGKLENKFSYILFGLFEEQEVAVMINSQFSVILFTNRWKTSKNI